jgi:hypothetical protein
MGMKKVHKKINVKLLPSGVELALKDYPVPLCPDHTSKHSHILPSSCEDRDTIVTHAHNPSAVTGYAMWITI